MKYSLFNDSTQKKDDRKMRNRVSGGLSCQVIVTCSMFFTCLSGHGPLFSVADGQMEVGLGVHGEAGVGRVPLASAHEAVARLLDHMSNPGTGIYIIYIETDKLFIYNRRNLRRMIDCY